MPPRDLFLVFIVILAWGSNFTAMKIALEELPPLLFNGLRFAILIPLIFVLPRPASWRAVIAIGVFINAGQFAFLFSAMEADVTAGLASLLIQAQAPITIVLAALIYRETVSFAQGMGIALAVMGLIVFGVSDGGNVTLIGLILVLCGALSWSCGNLVLRRLAGVQMMALFVWASLIPPLPMLGLSLLFEGPAPLSSIISLSLQGWLSVLYVAIISTIIGYSIWGALLSRHPASIVTPFALLIPVVGLLTAAVVLGETITAMDAVAAAIILSGIALAILAPRPAKAKGPPG
ncbi:MAG: EamA family transporter [Pseudomonadota bacterium]